MAIPEREPFLSKMQSTARLFFLLVLVVLIWLRQTEFLNGAEFIEGLKADLIALFGKLAANNLTQAKYGGES